MNSRTALFGAIDVPNQRQSNRHTQIIMTIYIGLKAEACRCQLMVIKSAVAPHAARIKENKAIQIAARVHGPRIFHTTYMPLSPLNKLSL